MHWINKFSRLSLNTVLELKEAMWLTPWTYRVISIESFRITISNGSKSMFSVMPFKNMIKKRNRCYNKNPICTTKLYKRWSKHVLNIFRCTFQHQIMIYGKKVSYMENYKYIDKFVWGTRVDTVVLISTQLTFGISAFKSGWFHQVHLI